MRVDLMHFTFVCGLFLSLCIIATVSEQLGLTHILADLPLSGPASTALLSFCMFGLAAARRRTWDGVVAAPWSAWSVAAADGPELSSSHR